MIGDWMWLVHCGPARWSLVSHTCDDQAFVIFLYFIFIYSPGETWITYRFYRSTCSCAMSPIETSVGFLGCSAGDDYQAVKKVQVGCSEITHGWCGVNRVKVTTSNVRFRQEKRGHPEAISSVVGAPNHSMILCRIWWKSLGNLPNHRCFVEVLEFLEIQQTLLVGP